MADAVKDGSGPAVPQLMKAERVAELMDCSRRDVYSMVHRGEIPPSCFLHIGRRLRFYADRLRDWLAENEGPSRTSAK